MASDSSKLKRLMQIASQLKYSNELNVDLLTTRLKENGFICSKRTLHRDISALKTEFNAPIRYAKSKHAYILDSTSDWSMEDAVYEFRNCSTKPYDDKKQQPVAYAISDDRIEQYASEPHANYGTSTLLSQVIVRCTKQVWHSSFDSLIPVEVKSLNKLADDMIEVELDAVDEQKFILWLFQNPSDITVLAPHSFKKKIAAACTAILEN